jgi:microcompartment protein CcmK/EutM
VIAGRVVASVAGTARHPAYAGRALLAVRPYRRGGALGATFLALDAVGAGIGDDVLVGRPPGYARELVGGPAPVRSIVLGILDAPPEGAAG